MREIDFDLWGVKADGYVVTTNGTINKAGLAVMGRGSALQMAQRYPAVVPRLSNHIKTYGNTVAILGKRSVEADSPWLLTFPTKHNWWDKTADINLILRSAEELMGYALKYDKTFVMPRPGCGNGTGNLSWEGFVKPKLEQIFDDHIIIAQYATPAKYLEYH